MVWHCSLCPAPSELAHCIVGYSMRGRLEIFVEIANNLGNFVHTANCATACILHLFEYLVLKMQLSQRKTESIA